MRLVVKNVKMFKEAEVEGDKIVLYGPNGGGKSTLMHLAAMAASVFDRRVLYDGDVISTDMFHEDSRVEFHDGEYSVEIAQGYITAFRGGEPIGRVRLGADEGLNVGGPTVWLIDGGIKTSGVPEQCRGVLTAMGEGDPYIDDGDFKLRIICPHLAQAARAPEVAAPGEIHYGAILTPSGWLPLRRMSYGQRRYIAIAMALEVGHYVLVENAETGLHADLTAALASLASRTPAKVILETHSGILLKAALQSGFKAYYVDEGAAREIRSEDLAKIDLFRRELAALGL